MLVISTPFLSSIGFTCYKMYSLFISVINQLDAQNFCFTISLFHVLETCRDMK